MQSKQKIQNNGYFDFSYFRDWFDPDIFFRIAIRPQYRDLEKFWIAIVNSNITNTTSAYFSVEIDNAKKFLDYKEAH